MCLECLAPAGIPEMPCLSGGIQTFGVLERSSRANALLITRVVQRLANRRLAAHQWFHHTPGLDYFDYVTQAS